VDVGFDEGRGDQGAAQVQDLASVGLGLGDHAIPNPNFPKVRLPREASALQKQIEHRQEAIRDLNFGTNTVELLRGKASADE